MLADGLDGKIKTGDPLSSFPIRSSIRCNALCSRRARSEECVRAYDLAVPLLLRPGRRRICGSISLRPERPDAMVQGLEGRPLWGRAVYTALHGACLSSVPSGDQSANPASVLGHSDLQRALLSVSSAQKCSGDGRLATPSGVSRAARSAVPCRSSVPGHRASRSKYTRGQSQETGSLSKSPGGVGALAKRVLLGSA